VPKLLSLFCKRIGKGDKGRIRIRRQRLNTHSPNRPRDFGKQKVKECSRVEKAMPGCRDEAAFASCHCCHLLIAGETVTPFIFILQFISNLVSDEEFFNCQGRLQACEIL
jgi:hypothetical protein